jgi:hypothetical protein
VATRRDDRAEIPGDRLKAAMDTVAVSSAALARVLDVDKTTVYRWREGVFDKKRQRHVWLITPLIWRACMSALGLPADWEPGDPVPPRAGPGPEGED